MGRIGADAKTCLSLAKKDILPSTLVCYAPEAEQFIRGGRFKKNTLWARLLVVYWSFYTIINDIKVKCTLLHNIAFSLWISSASIINKGKITQFIFVMLVDFPPSLTAYLNTCHFLQIANSFKSFKIIFLKVYFAFVPFLNHSLLQ